jgi:hypothetical protein
MIDLLEVLKGFTGKRVRISFYIGDGSGLHYFDQVGYVAEVSDHKVVVTPDPTMKGGDYPITQTTLLTEFVAIYAVDELDLDQPITEEETKKPGEFDDATLTADMPHGSVPEGEGWKIHAVYQKNIIWIKRKPKEPLVTEKSTAEPATQ